MASSQAIRQAIHQSKFADEDELVEQLLGRLRLTARDRQAIVDSAVNMVETIRSRKSEHSLLDTFLKQFGLSNNEGVALMCLAEALLRVPDALTADALIADKIVPADWGEHLGDSDSVFVNASTWGLMLTGKVISLDDIQGPVDWLTRIVGRLGEPVIRGAMRQAMSLLGREFVLGRTIAEATGRAEELAFANASYDMLGEGARTASDARRYFDRYFEAITAVAGHGSESFRQAVSVSIKLSALHPRYVVEQKQRVISELLPRLQALCRHAADCGVSVSLDAEEADRLELSCELFAQLATDESFAGWQGLGFVVQAYGKRALGVIDWLDRLADETHRRIPVRLVKGAYWDTEIKQAQVNGHPDFPVFTRKVNTDLSYLVCAERIFESSRLYGQFATHNAHTLAAVAHMGGASDYELQRLHGMGELLFTVAAEQIRELPMLRVYAPVGSHHDLLPYLVRRLLENGANSSFANRFLDEALPARDVVADPVAACQGSSSHRHPVIRQPAHLYGEARQNSPGMDLRGEDELNRLARGLDQLRDAFHGDRNSEAEIVNPARPGETVGCVSWTSDAELTQAFAAAVSAQPTWEGTDARARASCLNALADLIHEQRLKITSLLVREAGKTLPDCDSEIREAMDFCRYYASEALRLFSQARSLTGPTGEDNELQLHGRGTFVCISPWNFPLAITLGQISAAVAAGNTVVAKPSEQTPLIGALLGELCVRADFPAGVIEVVFGDARLGTMMIEHPDCAGVAFTGGTQTATIINRKLADRAGPIVPLIAETGGLNAMIVDSSALLEQVADDVITSGFGSAGQRCSALRVLFLQADVADRALELIEGAMAELKLGDPGEISTDVGPLISEQARNELAAHIERMRARGARIYQGQRGELPTAGHFLAPTLIELPDIGWLDREWFGPVVHVVRFEAQQIFQVLEQIRNLGFGLTLGVHSRIQGRVDDIAAQMPVGNIYINRNMIGAVVGVQPFGGQGLSGTGPKAGGPNYLVRFACERTVTVNTTAQGGNLDLLTS